MYLRNGGKVMSDAAKKMVYQKVPTDLNFVEREKKVETFWSE